ncbi:uncharacterized protein LOC129907363 [Episyrphus balteatus]|uniref:uncharacterized protein LOC129907363 n=1 Tax=Episyrphus balteatus TaxID=286459 RepID=UPI0024861789|nr:uncharacterized protein LOC129907363 [Episyrphus balteatus]
MKVTSLIDLKGCFWKVFSLVLNMKPTIFIFICILAILGSNEVESKTFLDALKVFIKQHKDNYVLTMEPCNLIFMGLGLSDTSCTVYCALVGKNNGGKCSLETCTCN